MPDSEGLDAVKADILVMTHVVNQLMEMAEVEGNSAPPTATVDLCAVCAEVAAMMAEIAIRQDKIHCAHRHRQVRFGYGATAP